MKHGMKNILVIFIILIQLLIKKYPHKHGHVNNAGNQENMLIFYFVMVIKMDVQLIIAFAPFLFLGPCF